MVINEVQARSILSISKLFPYVINPYTGCQHNCTYCYARFMQKYSRHTEPWGSFVDVKINAPQLLEKEVCKKTPGRVWISGVCDPYQSLEGRYNLTRRCLEILRRNSWPVTLQTRSPLVLRDLDILRGMPDLEVGLSVTTADDRIRRIFEPQAPPIGARLKALDELHRAGIRTFVMIAPLLPGAEGLADLLVDRVDRVLIDRMNYHYADWVYRKFDLSAYAGPEYYTRTRSALLAVFRRHNIGG